MAVTLPGRVCGDESKRGRGRGSTDFGAMTAIKVHNPFYVTNVISVIILDAVAALIMMATVLLTQVCDKTVRMAWSPSNVAPTRTDRVAHPTGEPTCH